MYMPIDKSNGQVKSRSVQSEGSRKNTGPSASGVLDSRPQAIAQRKLQKMLNSSARATQLMGFQAMADKSSKRKEESSQQTIQRVITDDNGNQLGFNEIWEELEVFDNFDGFDQVLNHLMGPNINITLAQAIAMFEGGGLMNALGGGQGGGGQGGGGQGGGGHAAAAA